jgi:hypothetical protein
MSNGTMNPRVSAEGKQELEALVAKWESCNKGQNEYDHGYCSAMEHCASDLREFLASNPVQPTAPSGWDLMPLAEEIVAWTARTPMDKTAAVHLSQVLKTRIAELLDAAAPEGSTAPQFSEADLVNARERGYDDARCASLPSTADLEGDFRHWKEMNPSADLRSAWIAGVANERKAREKETGNE